MDSDIKTFPFIHGFKGVFNLCQHFEISYSRYANKHFITGLYNN